MVDLMNNAQERKLIQRCQKGDRKAFEELVIKYQKRALNLAYRLLENYEDAQDVTQNAFVKAFRSIKKFKGESSFYTWLYRIIIDFCYRKFRSKAYRKRRKTVSLDRPIPTEEGEIFLSVAAKEKTPREILIDKERKETIHKAINSLKEKYRLPTILHDMEGLSYEELSVVLNCSLGTVRSRLHRARLILREKLRKHEIFKEK